MAFYNFGLRLLKHVRDAEQAGKPFMTTEQAVHRLTGELGEWYRIDAGTLREGDRADLVVIDPEHLDASLEEYAESPVEQYGGLSRMVNRNDAAVPAVFVSGRRVVTDGEPTDAARPRAHRSVPARRAAGRSGVPAVEASRGATPRPAGDRMTRTPEEAVLGLWRTLSARDYDGIADWVTDDCIYLDMPRRARPSPPADLPTSPSGCRSAGAGSRRTRTTTACSSPTATT